MHDPIFWLFVEIFRSGGIEESNMKGTWSSYYRLCSPSKYLNALHPLFCVIKLEITYTRTMFASTDE
jgi:hypothetical protein